jgi:hypothetical protein
MVAVRSSAADEYSTLLMYERGTAGPRFVPLMATVSPPRVDSSCSGGRDEPSDDCGAVLHHKGTPTHNRGGESTRETLWGTHDHGGSTTPRYAPAAGLLARNVTAVIVGTA